MKLEDACKKSRFKQAGFQCEDGTFILAEWEIPGKLKLSVPLTIVQLIPRHLRPGRRKEFLTYLDANDVVGDRWEPISPENVKVCKNCKKVFPLDIFIDGKWRNLRNRKVCFDCNPFKSGKKWNSLFYDKENKTRACWCCQEIKPFSDFYKDKRRKDGINSLCKKCHNQMTVKRGQEIKQRAIDYKGGKCIHCGYRQCNAALHFHHREDETKELKISGNIKNWEKLKVELDKCDLVCSNCHAEIHYGINIDG